MRNGGMKRGMRRKKEGGREGEEGRGRREVRKGGRETPKSPIFLVAGGRG